jgi:hypothetical protein
MIADSRQLAERVRTVLGDPGEWNHPGGYPDSLALCIIDSIQSIGMRYRSVQNVVERYRDFRRGRGGDPATDGSPELLATFRELDGAQAWTREIGNQNRTSTRLAAPLKALVIEQAAQLLCDQDVKTTSDLREMASAEDSIRPLKASWRELPGQRSGISWRYLLILAGVDNVKPDRMIRGFLVDQLPNRGGKLSVDEAAELVKQVAKDLGVKASVLDHRIWLYQSGRLK